MPPSPNPLEVTNIYQLLAFALVGLPAFLTALAAAYLAYKGHAVSVTNNEAIKSSNKAIEATNEKVDNNTKHVNSRMDQLLKVVESAAFGRGHAAGLIEGTDTEKARSDAARVNEMTLKVVGSAETDDPSKAPKKKE